MQLHKFKHETIYVLEGQLMIITSFDQGHGRILLPGEVYIIPPGNIHRMRARVDTLYLEASTSELDDVVRIQDDYGRV